MRVFDQPQPDQPQLDQPQLLIPSYIRSVYILLMSLLMCVVFNACGLQKKINHPNTTPIDQTTDDHQDHSTRSVHRASEVKRGVENQQPILESHSRAQTHPYTQTHPRAQRESEDQQCQSSQYQIFEISKGIILKDIDEFKQALQFLDQLSVPPKKKINQRLQRSYYLIQFNTSLLKRLSFLQKMTQSCAVLQTRFKIYRSKLADHLHTTLRLQ